jgi:hypothetical protein
MAGSYNHVVTDKGKLRNPQQVCGMLETRSGDVYEAVEEMYGMIWWLAGRLSSGNPLVTPKEWVEMARLDYSAGIVEDSPGRQKPNKELR